MRHALREAERNIEDKFGKEYLLEYYQLLVATDLLVQPIGDVEARIVLELEQVVAKKDVPIVLGALYSGAEFLITLDRKHLLGNSKLKVLHLPFVTLTPGDFIQNHIL